MTAFNMCTFFNNCSYGLNNLFTPFNSFSFNNFSLFSPSLFNFGNFATNFSFQMPTFNWNNINTGSLWNQTPMSFNTNFSVGDTFQYQNKKKSSINISDYNSSKGNKLAKDALNHKVGFTHYCSRYVNNALERTGLSNGQRGHGYQMTSILRNNDNFKEVSVSSIDYKNLPAGCILVFNKGAQGYSKEYGHVEISTGDGRAVSDGITRNIRKPSAVFVPV